MIETICIMSLALLVVFLTTFSAIADRRDYIRLHNLMLIDKITYILDLIEKATINHPELLTKYNSEVIAILEEDQTVLPNPYTVKEKIITEQREKTLNALNKVYSKILKDLEVIDDDSEEYISEE